MNKQQGFTLIELMLVALIVCMLVVTYWQSLMEDRDQIEDMTEVASQHEAVLSVLERTGGDFLSVGELTDEARSARCTDLHNAAYVVTVVTDNEGEQITMEATVCCRGIGRSRYCQIKDERILPPPPDPTP